MPEYKVTGPRLHMDLFDNEPPLDTKFGGNTKHSAKKAAGILLSLNEGYVVPTVAQRRNLLVAFAEQGLTLYGGAFNIVRGPSELKLSNIESIREHLSDLRIMEIKATNKAAVRQDFSGYFFSISTAELLTAQKLGNRYRFIFVNTATADTKEFSLQEVFARARGIYSSLSIQF